MSVNSIQLFMIRIHLPAQSGNSEMLKSMRRYYSREAYLDLVRHIKQKIPLVSLSSDFISGFCGETDEQFADTLSLLEEVKYDMTYLFAYSMRDKTHAYHKLQDNVPNEIKKLRLQKMIEVFKKGQLLRNQTEIGAYHLVLVEGLSKKVKDKFLGRTDTNKVCSFEDCEVPQNLNINEYFSNSNAHSTNSSKMKPGDYVMVKIEDCSNNTLLGKPITTIKDPSFFFAYSKGNPYIKI